MSNERTLYFFDFEFLEDGRTIDPVSLGIVCEDGRELYLCNSDVDLRKANDWVKANVIPKLPPRSDPAWMTKAQIAEHVLAFLTAGKHRPRLWAYFAAYDHVALCQLYGRMIDLPKKLPKYTMDLQQLSVSLGSPKHPEQKGGEHNALEDARWNRDLYAFLKRVEREPREGSVEEWYAKTKDGL